jgi:hypothetical protein
MSEHSSLADKVLVSLDVAAQIASTGINGTVIDMSGWSGVMYVFNLGAMASGATFDARVVSSANANMSVNANVANAAFTQITNVSNLNVAVLDVWRPSQRYLLLITTPATANTTYSTVAIRYGRTGNRPPTQAATQIVRVLSN